MLKSINTCAQTDRSLREGSYKESPKPCRETRAINSRYSGDDQGHGPVDHTHEKKASHHVDQTAQLPDNKDRRSRPQGPKLKNNYRL